MKESMWAAAIVVAGIIGVGLIMLFQDLTTSDQHNYYLLKEVTEAAMYDSIDTDYYRYHGEVRIIREKFVENFVRRWSASVQRDRTYYIDIYDVVEMPPKVTLTVTSDTDKFNFTTDLTSDGTYTIANRIDAIIETKY